MRRPSPTLEDVASKTGVSTATISRVLNMPDKVAPKTRSKVEAAIEELGYTPNFGGRALASDKSNTVGAVIPTMYNAMYANGIQAFEETLTEAGVTLLIATSNFDVEQEERHIRSLVAHGADGLLLVGNERPTASTAFLEKRDIPFVTTWAISKETAQPFVGFDNYKASYDATCEVLGAGHRKIALLSGITHSNDRARDRHQGAVDAIQNANLGASITAIEEARYLLDDGKAAFNQIWSAKEKPTVVICGNDVLAAGAMIAAREHGLSVPDDISFIGFDDIGVASAVSPALTTVHVPQIEMGKAAATMLLALISGLGEIKSIELDARLIQRGSLKYL